MQWLALNKKNICLKCHLRHIIVEVAFDFAFPLTSYQGTAIIKKKLSNIYIYLCGICVSTHNKPVVFMDLRIDITQLYS